MPNNKKVSFYNCRYLSTGMKDKSYVCKRGHYLEDLEKITKITPGPNKYDLI